MPVMLVGRGAQGVGAGLLTGLGFSLIHSTLPRRLWARGSALVSAMFGVGNLIGPAVGGVFAQFGSWRHAFVALAVVAIVLASFVPRILPPGNYDSESPTPVALLPLGIVLAAVVAFSVAGVVRSGPAIALCIAMAVILVATFIVAERHAQQPILPTSTYRRGSPLPWIYLTVFLLASGVAVETFLPLFGQQLGHLAPAAAGVFAAVLSLGWSVSQLVSSRAHRDRTIRRLQVVGPVLLATAFATVSAMQVRDASLPVVVGWAAILLVGGVGIGIAMPHLSVAAMASNDVPAEANKAGAAIATVLTMSTTFGSALAGLLVNLGSPSAVVSARHLLLGFAAVAALGIVTALRSNCLIERTSDHSG
jgi:predicted MFS family arabinose efflux permease